MYLSVTKGAGEKNSVGKVGVRGQFLIGHQGGPHQEGSTGAETQGRRVCTAMQKSVEGRSGRGNDKCQGVPGRRMLRLGGRRGGGWGARSEAKEGQADSGGLWGHCRGLGFHGVNC